MKILSLENLSLYAQFAIYPINFVADIDHLFSSFRIAKMCTAAFTTTQKVSCHLHSHSITKSHVKETVLNRKPDSNRSRVEGLVFLLDNYVLLCVIILK